MTSSPDWQKINEIFDAATAMPAEDVEAYLARACAGDTVLRAEVDSLISSLRGADRFMKHPAVNAVAAEIAGSGKKLAEGQMLLNYKILGEIGSGGMGDVYLAEDTKLNRKVALKLLPSELTDHSDRLKRFRHEARSASALNHPNIFTIYEIGESDGLNFIATEYIDGQTLRKRLKSGPVPLAEALDIAIQLASALEGAHEVDIVHRDIKPENIMLRPDGIAKLLDFGLAKTVIAHKSDAVASPPDQRSFQTQPGLVMGTANYMSPEQARGKPVDGRSDIWSLGIVVYEMLTGSVPFMGETTSDVIAAILKTDPPPLGLAVNDCPPELERIIAKALRHEPGERYQTAKDLFVDLKAVKQDLAFERKLGRNVSTGKTGGASGKLEAVTRAGAAANTTSVFTSKKRWIFIGLMLLLIAGLGFGYRFFGNRALDPNSIESMAVMPFINESGNPDIDYLSDGMTESLIRSLSRVPTLMVKGRASVFRYKGKEISPRQIAGDLNVQAILTGHVSQRGDQLTLWLELVDARTENVLWSERYNRRPMDLVALQSQIARDVANTLKPKLADADTQRIAKNYTENTEAYDLYLKGRFYRNRFTPEGCKQAIASFEQAIALDENYALAYAGLADAYYWSTFVLLSGPEGMAKAKEAARKAVELDEQLAEAHVALGIILYAKEWQFNDAEQHFRRSTELNPGLAEGHLWYGQYLALMGHFDEGLAEEKRAEQLEPLSPLAETNVGLPYFLAGRYDEAIAINLSSIELNPNATIVHINLGITYARKGDGEKAIAEFQRALQLSDRPDTRALLAYAYAREGNRAAAEQTLQQALDPSAAVPPSPYTVATVYIALGDTEKAFVWLEKSFAERNEYMAWLRTDPRMDPLRPDPRFQDLMRRVGL